MIRILKLLTREKYSKKIILIIFCLLISIPLAVMYGGYFISQGKFVSAAGVFLFASLGISLVIYLYKFPENFDKTRNLLTILGIFTISSTTLTNFEELSSTVWFSTYTLTVFAVAGFRNGIKWNVLVLAVFLIGYFYNPFYMEASAIPFKIMINILFATIFATVIMGFYAYQIEKIQRDLEIARNEAERNLNVIKRDLALAGELQRSILPRADVYQSEYIQVHSVYIPIENIGGDFFDFVKFSDFQYGIIIADVCGHGVQASMVASMIKVAFHSCLSEYSTSKTLIDKMNNDLFEKIGDSFFTACYVFLDFKTRNAEVISAGHMPLIVMNRDTGSFTTYNPTGRPMGITKDMDVKMEKFNFSQRDRILLYTDGITDSFDHNDHNKSILELKNILSQSHDLNSKMTCENILKQINKNPGISKDDLTMVMVDIDK